MRTGRIADDQRTEHMVEPLTLSDMISPEAAGTPDVDGLIEPHLSAAVASLHGNAPLLAGMAEYHLGRVDADLQSNANGAALRGKRIRPAVALLSCAAAGGEPVTA